MQAAPGIYVGTFDAATKIVKTEGFAGLYKGMSAPLVGIVPMFAISFLSFEVGKKFLLAPNQKESESLSPFRLFIAGMFSGITTTIFTVPGERIKCLLQMQTSGPIKYTGFLDCTIKLCREGGIRNLYVGTCATLLRDVPAGGFYFGAYELTMRSINQQTTQKSMWQPMFAGGLAGIANWLVAMPADVLKSRIQTASIHRYPRGLRTAFTEILRQEGLRGLYHGIIPVVVRSFPANAACFLGIEVVMKFFETFIPSF